MEHIFILSLVVSFVIGWVCTGFVWLYARRRLVDQVNERSSHVVPTPRGGGLGLTIGMLVGWFGYLFFANGLAYWTIGFCIGVIAVLGWWDDHVSLGAGFRFMVQLAISFVAVLGVGDFSELHVYSLVVSMPWWIVAIMCILGSTWMINLTNFMDGIDGLAGSQAVIGSVSAVVMLHFSGGAPAMIALALVTAGSAGSFLMWNWPPARIFMGDVGSTAIGLVFAVLVLEQLRIGISIDVALLPVMPFILDSSLTLARRAWRREALGQAHRSHLYQRLARFVGAHRPVTLLYSVIAILGAIGSVLTQAGFLPPGLAFSVVLLLFFGLVLYGHSHCPA